MKEKQDVENLHRLFPCSESKILDCILSMSETECSISDLSRASKVGFTTTLRVVHKMESLGVFTLIRRVGSSKMYGFNRKSPYGKSIRALSSAIARGQ